MGLSVTGLGLEGFGPPCLNNYQHDFEVHARYSLLELYKECRVKILVAIQASTLIWDSQPWVVIACREKERDLREGIQPCKGIVVIEL